MVSFAVQKRVGLIRFHLFSFSFLSFFLRDWLKKILLQFVSKSVLPMLSSSSFMAPHSSTVAWKILWMEEPGRRQSLGSLRVRHNWATSLSLFHFHASEKETATHSCVLAWRIPGTGEPGGLPSVGSHRVGHDWSDLAAAAAAARRDTNTNQSCDFMRSAHRSPTWGASALRWVGRQQMGGKRASLGFSKAIYASYSHSVFLNMSWYCRQKITP